MLKNKISEKIMNLIEYQQGKDPLTIQLYKEEKDYAEKYHLVPNDFKDKLNLIETNSPSRFADAYIERCEKESDQVIATEDHSFLNQPIEFFKKHRNEYVFLESDWFDVIGVDAISLELDDVFKTYDAMLGLMLPKKAETAIRAQLNAKLTGVAPKYNLLFNREDGVWDFNFTLNYANGFKEDMSIDEAYKIIYSFLFQLVADIEEKG